MYMDVALRKWEGDALGVEALLHDSREIPVQIPVILSPAPWATEEVHRRVAQTLDANHRRGIREHAVILRQNILEDGARLVDIVGVADTKDHIDATHPLCRRVVDYVPPDLSVGD